MDMLVRRDVRWMWVGLAVLMGGCGPAEDLSLYADMCTSYQRTVHGDLQAEVWTDVLPGNRVVRKTMEFTTLDGRWEATTRYDYGFDDEGLLVEERMLHRSAVPIHDSNQLVAHRYDAAGLRVSSVHEAAGVMFKEERRTYDDDGHLVLVETDHVNFANEWEETTWEDDRRVRVTTWREGEEEALSDTVWTYLGSSPTRDADVSKYLLGSADPWMRWVERYEDKRVVEKAYQETTSQPAQTNRYAYNNEGQLAWNWHQFDHHVPTLREHEYDAFGRLVRIRTGPDVDADLVLDEVEQEDLTVWTCR